MDLMLHKVLGAQATAQALPEPHGSCLLGMGDIPHRDREAKGEQGGRTLTEVEEKFSAFEGFETQNLCVSLSTWDVWRGAAPRSSALVAA